ncbi:MAG: rod shape-determining protein MreC [Halofilum sp. (in: g-proteobacteria)]
MQPLFQQGTGPLLRTLFFVLLSATLMVADQRFGQLEQVRGFLSGAIAPLRYAVDLPARFLGWGSDHVQSREDLIARVNALERENLRLRARQLKFETIRSENERLRTLLDSSAERDDRVLVAELLSVSLDPYRQQVVVNHGTRDGVYAGQPLIDGDGVMGQIIDTGPLTATALLISDPNHALPVQINRNGLRTIAEGTGETDRLELSYIPNNADVRVGDLVVSSGLGGRFPPNYPVATVVEVERQPGEPFARVIAEPRAQLDRSREVLLVWPDDSEIGDTTGNGDLPAEDTVRTTAPTQGKP